MANLIERCLELVNSKSKTEAVPVFLETLPDVMFEGIIIYLQCIRFSFVFGFHSWSREGFLFHILILIYICMIYINK